MSHRQREELRSLVREEMSNERWWASMLEGTRFETLVRNSLDRQLQKVAETWCNLHLSKNVQTFLQNDNIMNLILQRHFTEMGKKTIQKIMEKHQHEPIISELAKQLKDLNAQQVDTEIARLRSKELELSSLSKQVKDLRSFSIKHTLVTVILSAGLLYLVLQKK